MLAIIKKELKSYFLSPIGWIYIGMFFTFCSIFFIISLLSFDKVYSFPFVKSTILGFDFIATLFTIINAKIINIIRIIVDNVFISHLFLINDVIFFIIPPILYFCVFVLISL